MSSVTREDVRAYYGRTLQSRRDLKTSACCASEALPEELRRIAAELPTELTERFYGCGSPFPSVLEGTTVLDLGCGAGRDAFILSRLVGPSGRVIGVDMTEEQLAVASRHREEVARRFGYEVSNVVFRHGFIEDLAAVDVADASVDVVVSNCVINLSLDKRAAFAEVFRVLKPGGEICFADVFAGRRVPEALRRDETLWGECLGGAMYIEDFRRMLRELGCADYRVVARSPIVLDDPQLAARAGMVDFHSLTIRTFKLDSLEDICEDYGQVATYRGTIAGHPHRFDLDAEHAFVARKPALVCGNTAAMLAETRLAPHFDVAGDRSRHYGPFACAPAAQKGDGEIGTGGACC